MWNADLRARRASLNTSHSFASTGSSFRPSDSHRMRVPARMSAARRSSSEPPCPAHRDTAHVGRRARCWPAPATRGRLDSRSGGERDHAPAGETVIRPWRNRRAAQPMVSTVELVGSERGRERGDGPGGHERRHQRLRDELNARDSGNERVLRAVEHRNALTIGREPRGACPGTASTTLDLCLRNRQDWRFRR